MLHFIVAPYHLGQRSMGVGAGPLSIMETGVAARLGSSFSEIHGGQSCEWGYVNSEIAQQVGHARQRGEFPLVLAGNCNSCLGTLAALPHPHLGIVWFDAHGDFHTQETSISGSLEGMSLTLATAGFVEESRVTLVGGRNLEPGEDVRVQQRLCHVPGAAGLRAIALPDADAVYVHIDMDVLDPAISPGVNFQGAGGLTPEALLDALNFTFHRYRVEALAITNYNPSKDSSHRTRDIAIQLIEAVEGLRRAGPSR